MSGDWIKMRASLSTDPKVVMIASSIAATSPIGMRLRDAGLTLENPATRDVTRDVMRDVTVAALLRVWVATNEHTTNGVWRNSTLDVIDNAAGMSGFGAAMVAAEWASVEADARTVTLPNFFENNVPAKHGARSTGAERQQRYRDRKRAEGVAPAAPIVTPRVDSDESRNATGDVTVTSRSDAREELEKKEAKAKEGTPAAPGADLFAGDKSGSKKGTGPEAEPDEKIIPLTVTDLVTFGVTRDAAAEWLAIRRRKRAPLTPLAWSQMQAEITKAGWCPDAAVRKCVARGWQAFEASWVASERPGVTSTRMSIAEKSAADEAAARELYGA